MSVEQEPHLFDHVVINDDLEVAYNDFYKIIEDDLKLFAELSKSE